MTAWPTVGDVSSTGTPSAGPYCPIWRLIVPRELKLYYIKYRAQDGGYIEIATVRPETIFADTAAAFSVGVSGCKPFAGPRM